MELVKRKFINVGSAYGVNICKEAIGERRIDPESSMYDYDDRPIVRGKYYKCLYCRFGLKPKMCEKFACMRNERKDGKSVYFSRL